MDTIQYGGVHSQDFAVSRVSSIYIYIYIINIYKIVMSVRLSVGFPFCTRRKLSVYTFSGVFGVADHESDARFALKLHLPGAIDRFDGKIAYFRGHLRLDA